MSSPAQWARGRFRWLLRSRAARQRDRMFGIGGDPQFPSGVREPRRPKPKPPSDAVALQVPRENSPLD